MEEVTRNLDVAKILLSAILAPIVHWRRVLWFAIPLIVVDWASLVFEQLFASASEGGFLVLIALSTASLVVWPLLAVACHRIFILGEESMAGRHFVRWTSRETRFLGWAIGIGLVAAALIAPIVFLAQLATSMDPAQARVVSYIVGLPVLYVFTRLSLVLPATAIDLTPDFGWAWQASKRNGIRLMLVIGLLPLLLQALLATMPDLQSLVYKGVLSLVGIYVVVVEIAALSMSYRELARDHPVPASQVRTL